VYYVNAQNRVFTSSPGNLWYHRGHHISNSFVHGMLNLGGATLEAITFSGNARSLRQYGSVFNKLR